MRDGGEKWGKDGKREMMGEDETITKDEEKGSSATMFCLWNSKESSGQKFCPDSSLIDLIT
jgi:hypothetical protein